MHDDGEAPEDVLEGEVSLRVFIPPPAKFDVRFFIKCSYRKLEREM